MIAHRCVIGLFLITTSLVHTRNHKSDLIKAEETLDRKRVLVRLVSHEIRTPLGIVATGLKILHKELLKRPNEEDLVDVVNDSQSSCHMAVMLLDDLLAYEKPGGVVNDSQSSCHMAVMLLDDLLAYEKLEAGVMTLDEIEIDAWTFLKESVQPFYIQARDKGVLLEFIDEICLAEKLSSITLSIDRNKLNQVMRNLISNALKFTPPGGRVSVFALIRFDDKRQRVLNISVQDTGHGIAKESLPRLFKEIVQFNAGKLQHGGGSGLGLWLSNSIISLHGGKISAFSEGEGLGSTFSIELPTLGPPVPVPPSPLSDFMEGIGIRGSIAWSESAMTIRMSSILPSPSSTRMMWPDTPRPRQISPNIESMFPTTPLSSSSSSSFGLRRMTSNRGIVMPQPLVGLEEKDEVDESQGEGRGRGQGRGPSPVDPTPAQERKTENHSIRAKGVLRRSLLALQESVQRAVDDRLAIDLSPPHRSLSEGGGTRHRDRGIESEGVCMEEVIGRSEPRYLPLRALMVDDSSMQRKMMRRAVCSMFNELEEAEDGIDAVEKVKQCKERAFQYDVIFMDYQMPKMDGPTAAEESDSSDTMA
eukprot:CAMPEP_0182438738 /NCGR_PEP_ID=MMETSP1167-20130531/85987_1 /TAXON_ID=2988 /ORGANISM="Mallomonas Sp, Strain CCMP3275" /LENGTH=587 /DNA_ID=CAMNT_0024632237 /DNA_START=110 /DNA_END=1875 /DNA_ORIENTATION=-